MEDLEDRAEARIPVILFWVTTGFAVFSTIGLHILEDDKHHPGFSLIFVKMPSMVLCTVVFIMGVRYFAKLNDARLNQ